MKKGMAIKMKEIKKRKGISILISMLLILSLLMSSCNNSKLVESSDNSDTSSATKQALTQSELFDDYLNRQFIDYVTDNSLNLHSFLLKPENYGINPGAVTWGDVARISEEDIRTEREFIRELATFDRSKLTKEQQQSYDILVYQNSFLDQSIDLYYYGEPLSVNNGSHAFIPIILSEYEFAREKDVNDYLAICESMGKYMSGLVEFEQIKSSKGLFMSNSAVDKVVSGCEKFLSKKSDNILITSFNKRIDAMGGIDSNKKSEYKARDESIFNNTVIPAYTSLISGIKALKGTGKNSGGYANFEKGKEYYELCLATGGISLTADELISVYDKRLKSLISEVQSIFHNNPTVQKDLENDPSPNLDAKGMVDYWRQKVADDFPSMPQNVSFNVKPIDDTLKDMISSAFYIVPPLDAFKSSNIFYNPDSMSSNRQYMFYTLAHEGFPGHLLQNTSVLSSPLSNFRKVIGYDAYSEGWATYVQIYSHKYNNEGEYVKRARQIDEEFSLAISLRIDLGVNYQGWDTAALKKYMSDNGLAEMFDDSVSKSYFEFAVETPMEAVPYEAGRYEIQSMQDYYRKQMGASYNDKLFHTEFLKYGEAPFTLIKKWLNSSLLSA